MQLEEFLFCEMARSEASGQVSLIGLHAGNELTIQLPPRATLQLIPNLSCVVVLGDMQSVRSVRMQCQIRYKEQVVLNTPEQVTPIPTPKKFFNIMLNFAPFPCLQGSGDYEFRVTVQPGPDSPTTYSRKFRIEQQTAQPTTQH